MINKIEYSFNIEERRSFTEVYDIIMLLDDELKRKIPKKFIDFLKQIKLEGYVTNINPYIPLKYQILKNETNLMVSYIYNRYLEN